MPILERGQMSQQRQPLQPRQPVGPPRPGLGAVSGLHKAIGGTGARPIGGQGVPAAGGEGGPGDPQMWQHDPMGNRWQWQQQDVNGQGGKWINTGNTVMEGIADRASEQERYDAANQRQHQQDQADEYMRFQRGQNDMLFRRGLIKEDMTTGGGGPIAPIPRVTGGGGANAASDLAFARAKDRAGLATRGLLKSVQHNAAVRGIGGSGIESGASMDALSGGADRVANAALEQAIMDARRAQDVEDRDYAGGISQRGQDIAMQEAAAAREEARRQMMMESLSRLYGGAY